jgi:hypothetical protein
MRPKSTCGCPRTRIRGLDRRWAIPMMKSIRLQLAHSAQSMALLFASASALLRRSRSSAGAVIECDALGPARSMGEGRWAAGATHFTGQRWAPRPPRCTSAAGQEVTWARALGRSRERPARLSIDVAQFAGTPRSIWRATQERQRNGWPRARAGQVVWGETVSNPPDPLLRVAREITACAGKGVRSGAQREGRPVRPIADVPTADVARVLSAGRAAKARPQGSARIRDPQRRAACSALGGRNGRT